MPEGWVASSSLVRKNPSIMRRLRVWLTWSLSRRRWRRNCQALLDKKILFSSHRIQFVGQQK
jgi:hypothetical protein